MNPNDPILTRIVIRRNQSLSWRELRRFVLVGSIPSLVFVGFAVYAGWWPIAGFCAGAFMLAVLLLCEVMAGARDREVVTVTARRVLVEAGRYRPQMRVELDRYWARVEQRKGPPRALVLVSRGARVEVGAALSEAEQKTLARRLAALLGPRAGIEPAPGGALDKLGKVEADQR